MEQRKIYELLEICDFTEVFEELGEAEDSLCTREEPIRKIGHIRADYDGHRWWGNYFPCRDTLKTDEFVVESQKNYTQLVTSFPNLERLKHFCLDHPEAGLSDMEYNFYIHGEAALYWLRCILREKDYNFYLHAYTKTSV